MANAIKGEMDLQLGGQAITLRASYDTIVDVEKRLGLGLPQVALRLMDGELLHHQMAALICTCIPGKTMTDKQVGEAIVAAGYGAVQEKLIDFLTLALKREGGNDEDDEGNATAASG